MDTRALSLAFGTASAIMALIAVLLFGGVAGISDVLPEAWRGTSVFWAGVLTVIAAFIQGAISGAIIGAVYNRYEEAEWEEMENEVGREIGAAA